MIDVTGKKQIVIDDSEIGKLEQEFVRMFIAADTETTGDMYSGQIMENKYPTVYALFRMACL